MEEKLTIRKALPSDFDRVCEIYRDARKFMKENGNADQWKDSYPPAQTIISDLSEGGHGYVALSGKKILAVFYFEKNADDPDYRRISDGDWLSHDSYGVVHRIGVANEGRGKGIGKFCITWALSQTDNLKIDTHRDNTPMQKLLASLGFIHCGSIYLENGEHRMAYQFSKSIQKESYGKRF